MRKQIKSIKEYIVGRRSNRGITLVEVIVSIALIGILMVLMCNMFLAAFTITGVSRQKTQNVYNVAGHVGTGTPGDNVSVAATQSTVTVTLGGSQSQVQGSYENGATDPSVKSQYSASEWVFNPSN